MSFAYYERTTLVRYLLSVSIVTVIAQYVHKIFLFKAKAFRSPTTPLVKPPTPPNNPAKTNSFIFSLAQCLKAFFSASASILEFRFLSQTKQGYSQSQSTRELICPSFQPLISIVFLYACPLYYWACTLQLLQSLQIFL